VSFEKFVSRGGRKIAVDVLDTGAPTQKSKRKPFEVKFVKLPTWWIERLYLAKHVHTVTLVLVILREAFKRQHLGGEIILSSEVTGLPRWARSRAAKELVQLGLIKIEQVGNQAIRATPILSLSAKRRREEREEREEGPCVAPELRGVAPELRGVAPELRGVPTTRRDVRLQRHAIPRRRGFPRRPRGDDRGAIRA
jgi:hypothetical protein